MTTRGPNFFIVGAPKCGTTALYSYLSTHPEIFFPQNAKEPHYYNTDMPGYRWFPDFTAYHALFAGQEAQAAHVRGEASVHYLCSKTAAAEIADDVPDARILICLRAPVPFIRSYHNQMLTNLDEDITDLATAWHASGQSRAVAREPALLDYKSIGMFAEQIDRYRAVFADEQIRIMRLEDFTADPRGIYLALLSWLGVEDDGRTEFARVHAAVSPRSRSLAGFIKSPPQWVRNSAKLLKRVARVQSLGLARKMKRLNTSQGYGTAELDPELAEIIKNHYAQDQLELNRHSDLVLVAAKA